MEKLWCHVCGPPHQFVNSHHKCLLGVISQGWRLVVITLWICFFEGISSFYKVSSSVVFALHLKVKACSLSESISCSWKKLN